MAKDLDPKCKKCRRTGEKLFLKGERCLNTKCAMVKRNYPPGVHGPKGQSHVSNYGLQLKEKQKARHTYGILEKQFKNYYNKAVKQKGKTGELMLSLLERRLDNVVYRAGFAVSRRLARQLVNHGNFKVAGKNVDIPSYQTKVGEIISVKENKLENKYWKEAVKGIDKKDVPSWLELEKKKMTVKVLKELDEKDLDQQLDMNQIVEFYSK